MAGLFYKDRHPMDEHTDAVAKGDKETSKNAGAVARFKRTQYSNGFETVGRVHTEIFSQPKLLIGNIPMRVKFHRADPKFALMAVDANEKYSITIDKAILFVCQKKIARAIRDAHLETLLRKNVLYPVRKIHMKWNTRGSGENDITEPNYLNGTLPRRIILGLVAAEAFNGHLHHNPFNFQHFNVQSIILRKNGETVPFQSIEMDFANKCSLRGYISLMEGTNNLFKNKSTDIRPFIDYPQGYALYAFDLTQDHSGGSNSFDLIQQGNISLEIKLAQAAEKGVCIIGYLEYDALIQINSDKNVIYEQ